MYNDSYDWETSQLKKYIYIKNIYLKNRLWYFDFLCVIQKQTNKVSLYHYHRNIFILYFLIFWLSTLLILCYGSNGVLFKDIILILLLQIFHRSSPCIWFVNIYHYHPCIPFRLLLLPPKPQMPFSWEATTPSKVVAMTPTILKTIYSPPPSIVVESKEDMEQIL